MGCNNFFIFNGDIFPRRFKCHSLKSSALVFALSLMFLMNYCNSEAFSFTLGSLYSGNNVFNWNKMENVPLEFY